MADFSTYESDAYKHLKPNQIAPHIFGVTLWVLAMSFFYASGLALTGHALGAIGFVFVFTLSLLSFNPVAQFITNSEAHAIPIPQKIKTTALAGIIAGLAWLLFYFNISSTLRVLSFNESMLLGGASIVSSHISWTWAKIPARKFRFLSYLSFAPGMIGLGVLTGIIIRGISI